MPSNNRKVHTNNEIGISAKSYICQRIQVRTKDIIYYPTINNKYIVSSCTGIYE